MNIEITLTEGELKFLSTKVVIEAINKWDEENSDSILTSLLGLKKDDLIQKVCDKIVLEGGVISDYIKGNVIK